MLYRDDPGLEKRVPQKNETETHGTEGYADEEKD
jgi:hypothetical protein